MCRCVDFGSTNTNFFSARFIGGVSPVAAGWLRSRANANTALGALSNNVVRLDGCRGPGNPRARRPSTGPRSWVHGPIGTPYVGFRSEEHTSELQSRFDLVC